MHEEKLKFDITCIKRGLELCKLKKFNLLSGCFNAYRETKRWHIASLVRTEVRINHLDDDDASEPTYSCI